jgi:iron complex outermembrane receptor protein
MARLALFMVALLVAQATAAAGQAGTIDLRRLTIEELMRIDVTSATRRAEPVGTTAAAISVITADDIRRAGVTTIADALRLADGVHVARFNTGSWAISSRGFNITSANKLLVMIDGRTVYSPLFTGVFWNALDYVLEDIARIEVIRGPGATLWGANAVNGVVNIITRHSRETQGALFAAAAGNEDRGLLTGRYGGAVGTATWRAYAKFADRDAQRLATGASSEDARQRGQVGFRIDRDDARTALMLKGDAFHSQEGVFDRSDAEFTLLSLHGGWSRAVSAASRVGIDAYYQREYRRVERQLTHHIDTVDVDGRHAVASPRHNLVWGAGGRANWDTSRGSAALRFEPERRTYGLVHAFAQDEIAAVPDRLFVTVGAKYEWSQLGGGELQPNVRARLMLPRNQVLWSAVARAVRRPTRLDADVVIPGEGPVAIRGLPDFLPETLLSSEVGYRVRPTASLSLDATVFHHDYSRLRSQDAPTAPGAPIVLGNTLEGRSRGLELSANVQPAVWWRARVGYTWLDSRVERAPGSRDLTGGTSEANDPDYVFGVRMSFDLPRDVELDALVRAVGALPDPDVPAYAEMTLRGGWRITPQVEIWVVGEELLHDRHPEFGPMLPRRVEFERAARVGVTTRF